MDKFAFNIWRKRKGLPTKAREGHPLPKEEVQRRLRIVRSSRTIIEAANRIGMGHGAVGLFLKNRGLQSPFLRRKRERHKAWIRLAKRGWSDAAIARRYGVNRLTVGQVRVQAGVRRRKIYRKRRTKD